MKIGSTFSALMMVNLGMKGGNAGLGGNPEDIDRTVLNVLELTREGGKEKLDKWTKAVLVTFPLVEEAIARLLPSLAASYFISPKGKVWEIGIPSSLAFALYHNVVDSTVTETRGIQLTENKKFSTEWMPVPQFILGVYAWYLQMQYGFHAAVIFHSAWNIPTALKHGAGYLNVKMMLDQAERRRAY